MDNEVIVRHCILNQDQILTCLKKFDSCFDPPFSNFVDLNEYSVKLFKNANFVIAKRGDEIIGMTAYYKNTEINEIYIPYIVVENRFQGYSLGKIMVSYLIDEFQNGYQAISLEVLKNNIRALGLYHKVGFVKVEDRGTKFLMKKII